MPRRYFDEEQSNSKVGVVSDSLRKALRLDDEKCPIWIYRMRVLGYPPGYLKRARVSHSTFSMFEGYEQKEDTNKPRDEDTYNPDMFIEFPGFNVPLPNSVLDHCEFLGMPPMLPHQQLKYAKKTIVAPQCTPYKRVELMPLSKNTPNSTVNRSSESLNVGKTSSVSDTTATAKDLQADASTNESSVIKDIVVIEDSSDEEDNIDDGEIIVVQQKSNQLNESREQESQKLKLISMGSPLPQSTKKPPLEKFAVGMGSLIYFENLPTSTGVFDKMRNVIHKIREKRSQ